MRLALFVIFVFSLFKVVSLYGLEADQKLHQRINADPVDSLIIRSPRHHFSKKYAIVLLVISAEWEKDDREEIRKQWAADGQSKLQKAGESLLIFLVGRSSQLDKEATLYGDLLQVDIEEAYRNLVYKIEVGFRFIEENVYSDFVAKIDSDTVVHIDRLHATLKHVDTIYASYNWFVCHRIVKSPVIRDTDSPWYVAKSDLALGVYPSYCSGAGYVMGRETFEKIVTSMGKHKVFEVEDAFFTGVVAGDLEQVVFLDGATTAEYTDFSICNDLGRPVLSVLNTHYQFGSNKSNKSLTAAWERLKNPICYNKF